MSANAIKIEDSLDEKDFLAEKITYYYERWQQLREPKKAEWTELQNYLFATSTQDTSNKVNPFANTTTTPKLTQIRDNLHSNYMASVFSHQDWFRWEGSSQDDETKKKREMIMTYMKNKIRQSKMEQVISQLLYDYIDYGNAIADVEWCDERYYDPNTGELKVAYIGPKAVRISPLDIVFNPTTRSFKESPKITRSLMSLGKLLQISEKMGYNTKVVDIIKQHRGTVHKWDSSEVSKDESYQIQGFGNLYDYYTSGNVEILEFEGDIEDENGELHNSQLITVVDRRYVLRHTTAPTWFGKDSKEHVGWRMRPDNLWAMGPLDNLVGLQYRLDLIENMKADLFDLVAHPPLKIKGNVEEFEFTPFAKIFCGDDGDVDVLRLESAALNADMYIDVLERRMEDMAGAPRQAMGVRTPGEKTAFEIQALENNAGRIFEEKIRQFESYLLEPLLNNMLEMARRKLDAPEVIRTLDPTYGYAEFKEVTPADLAASGKFYAIGSRHWAATNKLIQNLSNILNSRIGEIVAPHLSGKKLADLVENLFELNRFDLFQENIAVMEQAETQSLMQSAQEMVQMAGQMPGTETL